MNNTTNIHKHNAETLMRRRKRHIAMAIAAAGLCGLAVILMLWGGNDAAATPAVVLAHSDIEYVVEADGLVESAHKAEIHAPSSLRVSEIFVREGDVVAEGDLLAQLDVEALTLEIQRAELNIQSAEANMSSEASALANAVTSARNALSSAELSLQAAEREHGVLLEQHGSEVAVAVAGMNLETARRSYANTLSLYGIDGASREMLLQAENALDKAQTAYDDALRTARESLDRSQESLDAAIIRHKTASDALRDATAKNTDPAAIALALQRVAYDEKLLRLREASITAPSGGVVSLINAKVGAPASGLLFVLEDDERLIVHVWVSEADIAAIALGTPCRIRPAGGDQVFDGVVTRLPLAAERDVTGTFAAVVGDDVYFVVEAALSSGQPGVRIGMNAKVSFVVEARAACFAVPNGLIYREGGHSWVYTRGRDGAMLELPVQIGLETRRLTEIIAETLYEGLAIYPRP